MLARLLQSIREQKLACDLDSIGAPTVFGGVSIRCTDEAAEKLRALPEVEAVVRD